MDNKEIIDNSDSVKSDEEREELSHGGGLPGGVVFDDEEEGRFVGSSISTSGTVGEHADIVMSATSVGVTILPSHSSPTTPTPDYDILPSAMARTSAPKRKKMRQICH